MVATPGADRIARGEEWLQTNTLDGQKAHDSFMRIGEPAYFQEFGPAGYHVTIGFANPAIINSRKQACALVPTQHAWHQLHNTVTGHVTTERMSRTPDERLYSSGSHDSLSASPSATSAWEIRTARTSRSPSATPMETSISGNFPTGNWRVTVFDQWNDHAGRWPLDACRGWLRERHRR